MNIFIPEIEEYWRLMNLLETLLIPGARLSTEGGSGNRVSIKLGKNSDWLLFPEPRMQKSFLLYIRQKYKWILPPNEKVFCCFFFFLHKLFPLIRLANEGKRHSYKAILTGITIPEPFFMMKVWFPCLGQVLFYTYSDNMNHSDLNSSVNGALQ